MRIANSYAAFEKINHIRMVSALMTFIFLLIISPLPRRIPVVYNRIKISNATITILMKKGYAPG